MAGLWTTGLCDEHYKDESGRISHPVVFGKLGECEMNGWRFWTNLLLFGLCTLILALTAGIIKLARDGALGYVHPTRAQRPPDDTPAILGILYQDITLLTVDGLKLAAWYTPQKNGAAILVAHGYGDRRSSEMHAFFAQYGYGVISWDFRAHGESEGELCTLSYREALDVEAALDFALEQPSIERVGAWGGSMGAASVINAAARRQEIKAVVADSAFPTLEDELEKMVTVGFLRPLVRFFAEREAGLSLTQARPVDQVGRISPRPVFIIQGAADRAIPADSAQRLYDAAGEPRTLWIAPGAEHMGTMSTLPDDYEQRVIAFFNAGLLDEE